MSLRSFSVFQDEPTAPLEKPIPPPKTLPLSPSLTSINLATLTALATSVEKENLHPITGRRASTPSETCSKKRKTTVLATKVHVPPSSGKKLKDKDTSSSKPEPKKRRTATSSAPPSLAGSPPSSKVKVKATSSRKESKASGSGRRSKASSRRVVELPRVEEEVESEKEKDRLLQLDIDERCYDLTVLPLADVTPAYDQAFPTVSKFVKDKSAEPELRDYFSDTLSRSTSRRTTPVPSEECVALSTPERKSIYSTFTFTSPSKSGERFGRAMSAPPAIRAGGRS
ncbi:hypothetical protein JAAARDRAFT_670916 [Jaapia argillacea MUCL 33604]|uniref:Uncharacterized protein n=1 Tax=Jaapia argillacea MUCL 33604 TaxID=933084 RepID=A0A067PUM4_9AGAM|nr:hypothetical protein JAAARDRAFT_670916 [Jaapia argillacea MUCL 33604]